MNAIEWSAKAVRQLRKIADKRKRQSIYAEVQQLANWPQTGRIVRATSSACKAATITGFASAISG
jgi:mRNA-degrading endonuclease RelE of RelBE toxin-antitoxin system